MNTSSSPRPNRAQQTSVPACPSWCTFDHGSHVFAEPGEHTRRLTGSRHDDFVQLQSSDNGRTAQVSVWLLGNHAFEFPLDKTSGHQLRDWASMLVEAAAELGSLDVGT